MDKVKKNYQLIMVSLVCVHFDDAGLGLALHSPVQSNPVWHGPVQHFT
jgi:hypothetical protein